MTGRHLLPDGTVMAYTDVGVGPPIVLLHGVLSSRRSFERNVLPLAERFRVIALDFRGHGDSDDSQGGNTVSQYARDLEHFLAAQQLTHVVAVGWSMGNFVIWDYVEQFGAGDRIAAQVCISQGPSDLTQADWPHGFTDHEGLRDMLGAVQEDYESFCRHVSTSLTHEELSPGDSEWMVHEQLKTLPNTAACILADQTQRDYRGSLKSLSIPVLGVWGRDEKSVSLGGAEWMTQNLADFTLEVFEASGHMPMWEEPGRFNTITTGWILDVLAPRRSE